MGTNPSGGETSSSVHGQRNSVASVHGYARAVKKRGAVATTPAMTNAANAYTAERRGGWSVAAQAARTPRPAAGNVTSPAPNPDSTPTPASVKAPAAARSRPPLTSRSSLRAAATKSAAAATKNA